ncbi:MAG: PPC domain-containing protein, partial [Pirellulaceae bacterium]|nr:PPC domain-containing protein [Pirellulaceae bacterium]
EGPILVNGGSNPAADVDYYRFQLQAGQNVVIDCRARRIDSDFEPNLVLYGPSGRQVAAGGRVAGGDVQLQFTAKTTGLHSIRLSDALFRGGENFYYRLSIGVLTRIDFIFPPAGQPGNQQFTIFGRNLPGGQNAGLSSGGHPLQKLTVTVPLPGGAATEQLNYRWFVNSESTGLAGQEYRLKGPASFSNPVLVGYATVPVVLEKEANNEPPQAQQIKPPCEVAGQFYPRRDEDWVQFEAKKGDVFWVEVVSQRLGLDTDPRMLVMQVTKDKEGVEQLKLLSNVDDGGSADGADFNIRTDDPSYRFEAPDDGVYKIQVRDEYSRFRADPKNVYRLCIRRPQPDFRLAAGPSHGKGGLLLRRGGRTAIRVVAFRRDGFDGPIEVAVTGLPAGVTCPPVVIGPARHAAMLVLSAAANAAPGVAKLQVSGKSVRDGKPLTRTARLCAATHPERPQQGQIQRRPPQLRLTDALVVTVTEEVSPVTLAAGDSKVLEMSRAARVKVPFTLARDGFKNGNIQITAADLPPNVQVANVAANGATAKGEIEIRLNQNTPLGRYTFFLNGQVQNLKYARNPEAATKAAARKKEVDAINADAKTKQTAAQKAKADADKNAAAAATAATAAQQAKTKADQAVTAAQQVQKAAATKRSQAQAALAKKADDAALKAADAAAQKALVDADAKLKTAQAAAVKAAQDMTAAQTKNTSAAAAKKVADEAFTKADEFAKAAVQAAAAATKRATDTANAAKPANRNLRIPSTPITIDVAPAPIRMKQPAAASVVQGAKAEAPIAVERLFSFADPVTLAIQAPGGVAG